jgi:DNA ligase-1
MNCFEVLEQLEQTSGSNAKLKLLRDNTYTPGLANLMLATFDYQAKYYVRDIPEPSLTFDSAMLTESLTLQQVCRIIDEFNALLRELGQSGRTDATRARLQVWLAQQYSIVAKWCRRAILRDLRCGVQVDTALKAGFAIPTFEVQLAMDAYKHPKDETPEHAEKRMKKLRAFIAKGLWVSRKLDGNRCLAHGVDGVFTLYTRNGTIYENFPQISEELGRLFPTGEHVFDGEIMSDDFRSMQRSAFANKRKTCVGDIHYNIFDMIPPSEWNSGVFEVPYRSRYLALSFVFGKIGSSKVRMVEHVLVHDLETIEELQRQYEAEGFEGAMGNPDIPYYFGRKTNRVLKFKSRESWDCVVVACLAGEPGKELEHTLGKVTVRQPDGRLCDCGSGFDREERDLMWANQDQVIGRIGEFKFQELTPIKDDGTGGLMRFPIFHLWRNFEPGEGKI